MSVVQRSDRAVIDWNSFDIGRDASVTFHQPSTDSVALNRVVSSDPSRIFGRLAANGKVFLVNPSGILFGPGARADVGGLVASTMVLRNDDFMGGNYRFVRDGTSGTNAAIVNEGTLTAADGGYLALLSQTVRNTGSMTASAGSVVLAAGDKVALDISGNGMLDVKVDPATVRALVENQGIVSAGGGKVLLDARAVNAILGGTVSNGGAIVANSMVNDGGTIELVGNKVQLGASSRVSASGRNGGTILITAAGVSASADVQDGAHIDANASFNGDGGKIVLRSDGTARIGGTFEARAGEQGGRGGFVETSAEDLHIASATTVSAAASKGQSGRWLIDPLDITVDAALAASLTATLNGGTDATVATTTNDPTLSGAGAGDITVSSPLTWNTSNALTLSAYRHVVVGQPLTASGGGSVVLRADARGNGTGSVSFSGSGAVSLSGAGTARIYYNPVAGNYAAPTNYSGNVSGGSLSAWMLVNNATQLQSMQDALGANYALGRDIDASATAGWNAGAGFVPIGNNATPFTGQFDGLGNTISGLTINRPATLYVGLFGNSSGGIRNLTLVGGSLTGGDYTGALTGSNTGTVTAAASSAAVTGNDRVGGLVGDNGGSVSNGSSSGNVSGHNMVGGLAGSGSGGIRSAQASGTVSGNDNIGGLLGLGNGAILNNVHASGAVSSTGWYAGGLAANMQNGSVANAYATGAVSGTGNFHGGLVGYNTAAVSASYATGTVSGNDAIGGLLGYNTGTVSNVHATGNVTATGWRTGGLTGEAAAGSIDNAYATGSVTGAGSRVGGLAGENNATITNSYADNTVQGQNNIGGLVGMNGGSISGSRAGGAVSGNDAIGGLIGDNSGTVSDVHATGAVSSTGWHVGGLVGIHGGGSITRAYARGNVSGNGSYYGGLVGSNNASISAAFASGAVTAQNNVGGLMGENLGTVSNAFASGTVSGNDQVGGVVGSNSGSLTNAYASGAVSATLLAGGLVASNSGTVNGSFWDINSTGQTTSAAGTGMSTAQMMTGANFTSATAANGNVNPNWNFTTDWMISEGTGRPRLRGLLTPLSVILNAATKTYDAVAYSGGNGASYSGFVDGDTAASLTGILAYGGTAQGALNVGTYSLTGSGLASNKYEISYVDSTLTISRKPLTVVAASKVYDGTTAAQLSLSGLAVSQTLALSVGSAAFDSKQAGTGKTVTASGISIADGTNGGLASNYSVNASITTSADITPRTLAVSAAGSSKVYDGTTAASVSLTDNHLGGDVVAVGYGSAAYSDKHVGTGKTIQVTGMTLSGADAGNYALPSVATATGTITPRLLTVAASGNDKSYDATTRASVTLTDDRIAGDSLSVVYGNAAFADKNVGLGKTIQVSGLDLTAADAGNYTLASKTLATKANITPAQLQITGIVTADKVYDGTTVASVSGARISPLGTDKVTLAGDAVVARFDDKNAGVNKRVTYSGFALAGDDAANYVLASPLPLGATITPRPLVFSAVKAESKLFDGSTEARGTVTLSGFAGNETVTASVGRAEFLSPSPGRRKPVSLTGIRLVDGLNGGRADNYALPAEFASTIADILSLPVVPVMPITVVPTRIPPTPVKVERERVVVTTRLFDETDEE